VFAYTTRKVVANREAVHRRPSAYFTQQPRVLDLAFQRIELALLQLLLREGLGGLGDIRMHGLRMPQTIRYRNT
jgi:hypothetical protein